MVDDNTLALEIIWHQISSKNLTSPPFSLQQLAPQGAVEELFRKITSDLRCPESSILAATVKPAQGAEPQVAYMPVVPDLQRHCNIGRDIARNIKEDNE